MSALSSKSFQPRLEALEDRSLMAANVTASLSNHVLSIVAPNAGDFIMVTQSNGQLKVASHFSNQFVKINGSDSVNVAAVDKIFIDLKACGSLVLKVVLGNGDVDRLTG